MNVRNRWNNAQHLRDQFHTWDRALVWHAFTQMAEYEPLILDRAQGCMVVDIDGTSSPWCKYVSTSW